MLNKKPNTPIIPVSKPRPTLKSEYSAQEKTLKKEHYLKKQDDNSQKKLINELKLIKRYMLLYCQFYTGKLIKSMLVISSVMMMTQIISMYFDKKSLMILFILNTLPIITSIFVGISIIRNAVLSRESIETTPFLNGVPILFYLNIITFLIVTTLTFVINTSIDLSNMGIQPHLILSFIGILISSLVSGIVMARFGFFVPTFVIGHDDIMHNIFHRTPPFIQSTFILVFSVKFISLITMVLVAPILGTAGTIIIGTLGFAIYQIFLFSLIGITFKISQKNNNDAINTT